ncbi:GNAT family N-acetyltransferase [Pseudoxanthomonas dokdonensis]|uniref:Acetyltransferase n=1 Tax=Pseudoxanthomonas dokdonensis TaxID=344882 RepID=A0A0R0CH70_9GAMM|nr:GNAT family N-acetyltransferase [Pseudoxanthomonas dokdonensis]KRG69177.1 acetyltransferase [Pseudoxanthomonas dokdonensis]
MTDIQHDRQRQRFSTQVDGQTAELTYQLHGQQMIIDHTGVPPAIGGRGIAADLVRAALEHARAEGWSVRPACSYAAAYIQRHPQYADLLASG